MIALVPQTEILCYVGIVDRGAARRIFSPRRANRREVKHYVQSTEVLARHHAHRGRGQGYNCGGKTRSGHAAADAEQLNSMLPMRALCGRPKSENKKLLVSVRYSPEVAVYFKSTGDGWQSRMDGALREYVARQSRRT